MYSNNPLSANTICFDCIANNLNFRNLEHADFFCRTYNLPWNADLWTRLVDEYDIGVFRKYTELILDDAENRPNLAYESTTHDLWSRTNKEWEKCRSFTQILNKIPAVKESYIERSRLKWGEQYTFEELIKLDHMYTKTLRANNITNPLQKTAVQTLCKLQIEMDEAIRAQDAKRLKDLSTSYGTFAKQADLEGMINETKTDDITTVAELYQFMEDSGFIFKYYDGCDRDEVDRTIKDIKKYLQTLVYESTGLQPLLEQMARKKMEAAEEQKAQEATSTTTLADLMNFQAEDAEVATEADEDVLQEDFSEEEQKEEKTSIIFKDTFAEEEEKIND